MLKELDLKESQGEADEGRGKGQTAEKPGQTIGGLHILVNNAGIGAAPFGLTKDGLGNQ
jgi:NAD(P)-dependent dehydrogenase (short-subunit alcohol dehydrogenase family)